MSRSMSSPQSPARQGNERESSACERTAPGTTAAPAYRVGYGKPPLHSRFKPGQSGNPRGRPKRSRNLKTELEEELQERVALGGGAGEVSKQRAMLKALTEKALKGDLRAASLVINMVARFLDQAEPEEEGAAPATPTRRSWKRTWRARGPKARPERRHERPA